MTVIHNPKDIVGNTKLPLNLCPPTAMAHLSLALFDGAQKYGKWNWRAAGIDSSVYIDAALRHIEKWNSGENVDADSQLCHLAHAMATLAIIIDAAACGKLTDTRAPAIDIGPYLDKLTPHIARLTLKHAGKNPKHYTVADSQKIVEQDTLDSGEKFGEKLVAVQG
jgi:hypothetical protein